MYIIPKNIDKMTEEELNHYFQEAVKRLHAPSTPPEVISSSKKIDVPPGVKFVLTPSLKDCIDENGIFSEEKFEKIYHELNPS